VTKVWGAQLAEPGPDGAVRIKFDDALWRQGPPDGHHARGRL